MTSCSYDAIPFDMEATSGTFFPLMSLGTDGPPEVTLTILLYSRTAARALYASRSRVTARNAIGQFAGRAIVHAGVGARPLILPTGEDQAPEAYSAMLTAFSWERHEFNSDLYRGTATWLIVSSP